jgi:hypothetical protein
MSGKECWNTVYTDIDIVSDSDFKGNKELHSQQSTCPKTLNSVGTNRKSISRNTPSPMSLFSNIYSMSSYFDGRLFRCGRLPPSDICEVIVLVDDRLPSIGDEAGGSCEIVGN